MVTEAIKCRVAHSEKVKIKKKPRGHGSCLTL